jgi:Protein of unknown function (DUF2863)
MKENRVSRTSRERSGHLSPDAERLILAATGLAHSGSRLEDRYWERYLDARVDKLLDSTHGQALYDAMERLHQTDLEAYGALVESVESAAECVTVDHQGERWDLLLLSIPVVAWTRFKIPSGALSPKQVTALSSTLQQTVLAESARLSLAPHLYSVDQLPRDFNEVRRWVRKNGPLSLSQSIVKIDTKDLPETAEMLADARFILGVLAVPSGQEVFRWQEFEPKPGRTPARERQTRVQSLEAWIANGRSVLETSLPGCGFECLLPDAYHLNLRETDRRVRPYSIKAGVNFVEYAMGVETKDVKAAVAGFGGERVDEFRIGLSVGNGDEVFQGVVWPLFGAESDDDEPTPLESIKQALREAGVSEIRVWPELMDPEFCEDCGAPMYPNQRGDVVHVEAPEDAEPLSQHFH